MTGVHDLMSSKPAQNGLKLPGDKKISPEYVERLSRILLAFCGGSRELLGEDSPLDKKLSDLIRVIEKTLDPEPPTGLAGEISDYFEKKSVEDQFRSSERQGLLGIVRELTHSLKEIGEPAGGLDEALETFVNEIDKVDKLEDLEQIKSRIRESALKVQGGVKHLRQELDNSRQLCQSLQSQLEKTEATSIMDSLTRVLNRSAFDMRIQQTVNDFKRFEEPCMMMVVDIDHFKNINDTHGHLCGDKALASIAHTIKQNVREADQVFRYGGEEFVVLLPKTGLKGAKNIAEKIRKRVAEIRTHLVNDLYADREKRVEITVSMGLAELSRGDSADTWFQRADEALYRAKAGGRNRVETEADI